MPRFFVTKEDISDVSVTVRGDDAFHIARALRMAVGDEITVADMQGIEYVCRLTKIRDDACDCEIIETRRGNTESPVDITLYMAYPKGDKLEVIIQKAVELGALKIVPFESSRCVKRPKADKAEKQNARLNKIAEEAAKQCGRSRLPEVSMPISFQEMLKEANSAELALFCYEGDGTIRLSDALSKKENPKTLSVVVGCEGGFSAEEAKTAVDSGLFAVNLGPRILRCETAPTAVLSVISYVFEL